MALELLSVRPVDGKTVRDGSSPVMGYVVTYSTSGTPAQRQLLAERCWIDHQARRVFLRFRHSEAWAVRRSVDLPEYMQDGAGFFVQMPQDAFLFQRILDAAVVAVGDAEAASRSRGLPPLSAMTASEALALTRLTVSGVANDGRRLFEQAQAMAAAQAQSATEEARDTDRAVIEVDRDLGPRPALPLKRNKRKELGATYVPYSAITRDRLFSERLEQLEYRIAAIEAELERDLRKNGITDSVDAGAFVELQRFVFEHFTLELRNGGE